MNIRDYWSLPPEQQAALRAAVLLPDPPRQRKHPVAVRAYDPLAAAVVDLWGYKAIYARDLLHGLGDVVRYVTARRAAPHRV